MYFYHLVFELFLPITHSSSAPKFTFTDINQQSPSSLLPAYPSDIFQDTLLPSYRIGTVDRLNKSSKGKSKRAKRSSSLGVSLVRDKEPVRNGLSTTTSAICSPSLSSAVPQLDTPQQHELHQKRKGKKALLRNFGADWRAGDLVIEWFNMKDSDGQNESVEKDGFVDARTAGHTEGSRAEGVSQTLATLAPRDDSGGTNGTPVFRRQRTKSAKKKQKGHIVPTSGAFIPYKAGKTEFNAGILHLYRDRAEVQDILQQSSIKLETDMPIGDGTPEEIKGTGTILCVLAVPSYMTAQDFLNFVGSMRNEMSHLRIVRDSLPNRYMVLIKFRDTNGAEHFYKEYNGRNFSSLEPEACHVVYIKSVEFKSQAIPPYAFPPLPDDPSTLFLPGRAPMGSTSTESASSSSAIAGSPSSVSVQSPASDIDAKSNSEDVPFLTSPVKGPFGAATNQLLELPTCPVCLDRMDASVTGLLTIVCHHTFHCHCLSKWGDSSCPVCRYSSRRTSSDVDSEEEELLNECMDCGATENLWICLICGNIGCGRYQEGHAQNHFTDTQHLYAMELESQRVWDYAGDGYVHRLIQNRADGKLVELPAPTQSLEPTDQPNDNTGGLAGISGGMVSTEKMESIGMEYTYLLTSQLESQRLWYESRLTQVENGLMQQVSVLTESLDRAQSERDEAVKGRDTLQGQLARLEKDNRVLQNRLTKLLERIVSVEKDMKDERALSKSLLDNQSLYQAKMAEQAETVRQKDAEIVDLKEQVRDLMAFLDMRKQVEECGVDEVKGAQLLGVAPTPSTPGSRRKGKRK